jgi:hypothetical protein
VVRCSEIPEQRPSAPGLFTLTWLTSLGCDDCRSVGGRASGWAEESALNGDLGPLGASRGLGSGPRPGSSAVALAAALLLLLLAAGESQLSSPLFLGTHSHRGTGIIRGAHRSSLFLAPAQ